MPPGAAGATFASSRSGLTNGAAVVAPRGSVVDAVVRGASVKAGEIAAATQARLQTLGRGKKLLDGM